MDKEEAKRILREEIDNLKKKSYSTLCNYLGSEGIETKVVDGLSGVRYQLEIMAFWDGDKKPDGNLRVMVNIDDGGIRSFFPVSDSFIITPEGTFLGE